MGERDWADTVKGALRNMTNISFKQVSERDKVTKLQQQHAGAEQQCF